MIAVILAILPVFAAIALGKALAHAKFLPQEAWAAFDRMNYYVFFPALIIHSIARADFAGEMVLKFAVVLLGAVGIVAAALILIRPLINLNSPSFASLFQCCIRWNGFMALAAALTLLGSEGVALVAIGMALVVPTVNVLSVLVLAQTKDLKIIGKLLATNPLILACAAGVFLNVTGIGLPEPFAGFALILGRGALALGLLSVGAGLNLALAASHGRTVALGTAVKLLVMPILVFTLAKLMGLEGLPLSAVMLIASVPTATSGYVLARQLGGDAPLMAGLVTSTSLVAIFTMPLWLALVS